MASYHQDSFTLAGMDQPLHVSGETVSGDFFSILGTQPLLGRGFTREEEKPGTRVVVLSHDLWQSAFHGDRGIIGRAITMYKESYTVVGVMPAGFAFPLDAEPPQTVADVGGRIGNADPKNPPAATSPEQRGAHFLPVVARLKPGVPMERRRKR